MTMTKVKVLVIDDSAFNRRTIVKMLASLPDVEVVGYACDGEEGLRKVLDLKPDLITLDLEMPRMDGFTLLRIVMQKQPTPVIIVSSRSDDENVFKALELGAVEFVRKPSANISPALLDIHEEFINKVREVTAVNLKNVLTRAEEKARANIKAIQLTRNKISPMHGGPNFPMVVMGSSTGGPPALHQIFSLIRENVPVAFAVAQHMPPGFTKAFAERLNRFSALNIHEATDGDLVEPGHVLIAPGGKNLEFTVHGSDVFAKVSNPLQHQRYLPSVDSLFNSSALVFGNRLLGVVLTGMGNDGSEGVRSIKRSGGMVIAESEETCVVYGMPKVAIASGQVDHVVPLPEICAEILHHCGY